MAEVFTPENGFNLTFGKQDWKQVNKHSPNQKNSKFIDQVDSKKNSQNKMIIYQNLQNKYAAQFQKIMKKSYEHKKTFDKQNINLNNNMCNSSRGNKIKRRPSLFDHDKKIISNYQNNFLNVGEQILKRKKAFDMSKSITKQNKSNLYDIQLRKRLNEIELFSKCRTQRHHKLFSQHQEHIQHKDKNIEVQNNNFVGVQAKRKVIPRYYEHQSSTKANYKDEMQRIDGLIQKINTRIKSSMKNFS